MAVFPASEFHLDGEPAAIRASAGRWSAFGAAATDAAAQIRSLDSSLFVGPEGDQYRAGLNQDLPPHLDITGRAYMAVGSTLTAYATSLTSLQDRMAPLQVKAPGLWEALQKARGRVATAHSADQRHELQKHADAKDAAHAPDIYQSDLGAAMTVLSTAEQAWNDCLTSARAVTVRLRAAVDGTERAIRDAADLRFAHNPHGVHALASGFRNFVTDHATGLSQLSGALKIVSGIAGVLSFIPVIGQVAFVVALVTAGGALLIDTSLKYATGEGSWTNIAIDGALLALPGIGKGITALRAARSAEAVNEASGAASSLSGARLTEHLRQAEKYGNGGFRQLESGRIRYYGKVDPPRTPGRMAGRRIVREWDPRTGAKRTWNETLDHGGNVRIARPVTGGPKIHYTFDEAGRYGGSW